MFMKLVALATFVLVVSVSSVWSQAPDRVEVVFSGGHDTDPRDHGRPDVLIAAALGVTTEVFREAFSHVTPAAGGREPEPEQVRRNKAALLAKLGPFGVTNERLDTVSDYYRYNRGRGEGLWRALPATAYATVRDGRVVGITVTSPGSGYTSEPRVVVAGIGEVKAVVRLAFGIDLAKNGSIADVVVSSGVTVQPRGLAGRSEGAGRPARCERTACLR